MVDGCGHCADSRYSPAVHDARKTFGPSLINPMPTAITFQLNGHPAQTTSTGDATGRRLRRLSCTPERILGVLKNPPTVA